MNHKFTYIRTKDYDDYVELNGGVPRLVVQTPVGPADIRQNGQAPQPHELVDSVSSKLNSLIEAHQGKYSTSTDFRWFLCHCIEVNADDGMSWSAEKLSHALRDDERFSHFQRWELTRKPDTEHPWRIADFIGPHKFLRLAGKHKLGSALITGRSWLTWTVGGIFVAISVAIALFDFWTKNNLTNRPYYFLVASALLTVATKYLAPYIGVKTFPDKLKSFEETLEKIFKTSDSSALGTDELPPNYEAFIESLAAELAQEKFPRYVIVEDFSQQDSTTKNVISRYFDTYAKQSTGGEFWIIFDGHRGPRFSTFIRNRQNFYGYQNSKIFRQLFISEREKYELVEKHGLPQSALAFRAIKLIRRPDETASGVERVKRIIDDYRIAHPKSAIYGDLEFLYLLTLTGARPPGFSLGIAELNSKLRQKRLRAEVLAQLLPGTRLIKSEFEDRFNGLRNETQFQNLIEFSADDHKETLHINVEATLAFEQYAGNWGLHPAELGHLYWSLYWLDDRTNKRIEAYWMDKLSEHLVRTSPASLDPQKTEDLKTTILEQLFNGNLETATGCLKTCTFDDVPKLLRKAFDLIDSKDLANNQAHQERIIKKCWEAYSLLGNDEILEVLLDLYECSGGQGSTVDFSDLPILFFQSMPLTPAKRAMFTTSFFKWLGWSGPALASITQYAHVRSAWLAFSVNPVTHPLIQTSLHKASLHYDQVIANLTQTALERIKDKSEAYVRITDVLTVSLALWCCALRVRLSAERKINSAPDTSLEELLDLATSAVLRASEIKKESRVDAPKSSGVDFLSSGLAKELYSVALGAVLLGCRYAREIDARTIKHVNDVVSFSNELMDFELKPVVTIEDLFSDRLVRQADQMLTFCEILWEGFGFNRLRDFMNLRRIHFNSMMLTGKYKNEMTDEVIRESLGTALSESNFTGLIANFVVADCLRQVGDIEALYLRRAGGILLSEAFDPELRHELCMAIINETSHLRQPLDDYISNVLTEDEENESYLLKFLKQASVQQADQWLLVLHNVAGAIGQADLKIRLKATFEAYVDSLETPEMKSRIEAFLAYHVLTDKIKANEPVLPGEVLHDWQDRKSSPFYAAVLYMMLSKHPTDLNLMTESIAALDHDPREDTNSSPLNLASTVVGIVVSSKQKDHVDLEIPLRFLRQAIELYSEEVSVSMNLHVYTLLYNADSAEYRNGHYSKKEEWTKNILLTRNLQLLTSAMGTQKQYFLVFRDYYQTMRYWGLKAESVTHEAATGNGKQAAGFSFATWLQGDRTPPVPLIGNSVSTEFLEIGNALFSSPNLEDATLHDSREQFDQVAREIMPKLLTVVIELDLPTSIKNLLRAYSERFSPPKESPELA